MTSRRIRKIVILGGGTAGFLTGLALKRKLPGDVEITLVHSSRMGVIGVGEGTIPSVVNFLKAMLGLDEFTMYSEVEACPKLGIRYLWGKRPYFNYTFTGQLVTPSARLAMPKGYYCDDEFDFADLNSALMNFDRVCMRMPNGQPRFNRNVAYHLENRKFVSFLEKQASEAGLPVIDAVVTEVCQSDQGVEKLILENGQTVEGDFFVDCSGFRGELIRRTLKEPELCFREALFCDSAIVGGWERTDETLHPFTTAETMEAGWCWRIEHDHWINRGYVYSSTFLSDERAEEEFRKKNPKIRNTSLLRFNSFVHDRTWVKNVVAIGNAAGFVEPLEATAIGMICDGVFRLVKALQASQCQILEIQQNIYNRVSRKNWTIIRDFLALHYKFNDRFDTPFWQAARNEVEIGDVGELVEYYQNVGPDFSILSSELKRDFFTAEGYLVMLVGQRVPYQRETQISHQEQQAWESFRDQLRTLGSTGVNVPEFLEIARRPNARQLFGLGGSRAVKHDRSLVRIGETAESGELKWH